MGTPRAGSTILTVRHILVKVEYHGQVWYDVKEAVRPREMQLTMGLTHVGKHSKLPESTDSAGQAIRGKDSEASVL